MDSEFYSIEAITDGALLSSLNPDLGDRMRELGLCNKSGEEPVSVSFVGLIGHRDSLYLFLPKCSPRLVGEDLQEYAAKVFRVLSRFRSDYSMSHGERASVHANPRASHQPMDLFHAYECLIDDWIRSGVWSQRSEKHVESDRGEALWERTIATRNPVISGGVPIYASFITRMFSYSADTPIAALHLWAVSNALRCIGWVKGVRQSELGLVGRHELPGDLNYCSNLVSRMRRRTFDRRKIALLDLIETALGQLKVHGPERFSVLGVKYFWPVWESICRVIYCDNKAEHEESIPYPAYRDSAGNHLFADKNIGQNPDLMAGSGDDVIIADAKYYDIRKSQPGWSDLVKQFFYAKTVLDSGYASKVDNRLVFPLPPEDSDLPKEVTLHTRDSTGVERQVASQQYNISCDFVPLPTAFRLYLS